MYNVRRLFTHSCRRYDRWECFSTCMPVSRFASVEFYVMLTLSPRCWLHGRVRHWQHHERTPLVYVSHLISPNGLRLTEVTALLQIGFAYAFGILFALIVSMDRSVVVYLLISCVDMRRYFGRSLQSSGHDMSGHLQRLPYPKGMQIHCGANLRCLPRCTPGLCSVACKH